MPVDLANLKEIIDMVQGVVTIAAITIGAAWSYILFVSRRQRYPCAKLAHQIAHKPVAGDKVYLSVIVEIANTSDVLLSLVSGETRIQQIAPVPTELLVSLKSGDDLVAEGETEIPWPLIGFQEAVWHRGHLEFEPGGTGQVRFDFILDGDVKTIKVYSWLRNTKKRRREIGWGISTICEL